MGEKRVVVFALSLHRVIVSVKNSFAGERVRDEKRCGFGQLLLAVPRGYGEFTLHTIGIMGYTAGGTKRTER